MKKKKVLYLILPIITLILEALPYGAVLNFANPEGEPWRKTYSYFSLTPFGYANGAPLFTAIITCIIFLLLVIYCFTNKETFVIKAKNILYVCIVFSFGPLIFGIKSFSFIGLLISLTLIIHF